MNLYNPSSRNLRKFGQIHWFVWFAFLALAAEFWTAGRLLDDEVMDTATYGDFITRWPAEMWAGAIEAGLAVGGVGMIINGSWRWSPVLRLVGAIWNVTILVAMIISAWHAANGLALVLWGTIAIGMWLCLLFWGLCDVVLAVRGAR